MQHRRSEDMVLVDGHAKRLNEVVIIMKIVNGSPSRMIPSLIKASLHRFKTLKKIVSIQTNEPIDEDANDLADI